MTKPKIRPPFLVVNPKAYLYGEGSLKLAVVADALSEKFDIDIFFTCQYVDVRLLKSATSRLILTAQHMDPLPPGAGMGRILPEGLKEAGFQATFLNHAEHALPTFELVKTVARAKELELLTIICADSLQEAEMVGKLEPDIMVCEQSALIGTGKTGDLEYMRSTNQAVRRISPGTLVLQAAGISSGADVEKAIRSGADGTGGTSGIVGQPDPAATLTEMVETLARLKAEANQ
jgi:triosephosphate isomerase